MASIPSVICFGTKVYFWRVIRKRMLRLWGNCKILRNLTILNLDSSLTFVFPVRQLLLYVWEKKSANLSCFIWWVSLAKFPFLLWPSVSEKPAASLPNTFAFLPSYIDLGICGFLVISVCHLPLAEWDSFGTKTTDASLFKNGWENIKVEVGCRDQSRHYWRASVGH